jgi:hypothetical protein
VVGTVVGPEVGIYDGGETLGCEVVGTVVGADVGIEDGGETVGCEVAEHSRARTL